VPANLLRILALLFFGACIAGPALAQPSCFSGPYRDAGNSLQTYRADNRCGGWVKVHYLHNMSPNEPWSRTERAFASIAPCKEGAQVLQTFVSAHVQFTDIEWDTDADSKTCIGGAAAGNGPDVDPPGYDNSGYYNLGGGGSGGGGSGHDSNGFLIIGGDVDDPAADDDLGGVSVAVEPKENVTPLDQLRGQVLQLN
jgi:hypothetical protein